VSFKISLLISVVFFCEKFPPFSQEPWQDMKFILVAATLPATATPLGVAKRPSDATGECLLGLPSGYLT
jgi:hypothetical protein